MSSKKVIAALNEVRQRELLATIQYMGHHYEAVGLESPEIREFFKKAAVSEMKHAESLAERLVYLGETPSYAVGKTKRGGTLKKMLQDDLDLETGAIEALRKHIKTCAAEGDPVSRLMLEEILADEEHHADDLEIMLGRPSK